MNWQDLDIFSNLDNTQGLILVGFLFGAFLIGIFTHWLFVRPRLRRLRKENRKLQKDLNASQEKYYNLQEHYTVQEANLKRLNTEKKEQTQQLLLAENEQKQLAQRVEDQSTELRQYKRIKESAEAELADFKVVYKELEADKQKAQEQLVILQQKQEKADAQVSEKEQQLAGLQKEQEELQEELNLAKDSLQVTKEQLLDLQGYAAELEQHLEESKSSQKALRGQADELERAKEHIAKLEAQLKVAQGRLEPYIAEEEQAEQEQAQWDGALAMAQAALDKFGLYQKIPASLLEEFPEKIAATLKAEEQLLETDDVPLKIDDDLRFKITDEEADEMLQSYQLATDTVFKHPFYAYHGPEEDQELLDAQRTEEDAEEEEEDYDQSFSEREENEEAPTEEEDATESKDETKDETPAEEQDWSDERFERALKQAGDLAQSSALFGHIDEEELIESQEEISRNLEEDEVYAEEQKARSVQAAGQEESVEVSPEEAQHFDRSLKAMQFVMRNNPFFDEMDESAFREQIYDESRVDLDAIKDLDNAFEEEGQLSRSLYAAEDLAQSSLMFSEIDENELIEDKEQVSRNLQEDADQQARSVGQPKVQINDSEREHLQTRLQEAEYMLKGSPLFDDETFEAEQYYTEQQKDLERVDKIARRIEEQGAFYGKKALAEHALANSPLFAPIAEEELIESEEQISRSLEEDDNWLDNQVQGRGVAAEQTPEVSISEAELKQMQNQLHELQNRWGELFDEEGILNADVYQESDVNEEAIDAVGRGFEEEDVLQKRLLEAEKYASKSLLFDNYTEDELVEDEQLLARRLAEKQPEAPLGRGAGGDKVETELSEEESNQLNQRLEQAAYYLTNSPLFGSLEDTQSLEEQGQQPAYLTAAEERLQKALLQDIPPAQKEAADDLKAINGIGNLIEKRLNDLGIYNYQQIAAFDDNFITLLAEVMGISAETIQRDDWRGQAEQLTAN